MKTTLILAGLALILVLLRSRTGWTPSGRISIGQGLGMAALIGGAGIVIAVSTGNWLYLILIAVAAAVGGVRLIAYHRTGRWR